MTTTARKPTVTAKRSFLDRWMSDPEAYPEEFKSWLINFVQQNPNLLLDITSLPRIPASKFTPDALAIPLSIPVLRAEFGGTAVGFTAGNYLCNQDGQPKAPATLQNFRVITFTYDDVIDAPPPGYKVQWQLVINPKPNGTNSLVTWTFSPFVLSGGGGGAGGFTETLSGSFISPSCSVASPGSFATFGSGWVDGNVTGGIQAGLTYAFLVNLNTGMAGNSAFSWSGRLYRRFVPA